MNRIVTCPYDVDPHRIRGISCSDLNECSIVFNVHQTNGKEFFHRLVEGKRNPASTTVVFRLDLVFRLQDENVSQGDTVLSCCTSFATVALSWSSTIGIGATKVRDRSWVCRIKNTRETIRCIAPAVRNGIDGQTILG